MAEDQNHLNQHLLPKSNILHKMDEVTLVENVKQELLQFHNTKTQGFIYRVTEPLRSVNRKGYEPDILAIGPYHNKKDKYKMMEEHKLGYLQSILDRKETTLERYISVVSEFEKEARNCYSEAINLNRDNFIKMLVLDGCFIIELALKYHNPAGSGHLNDPIFKAELIRWSLARDLILFENQIPFFILCKLFDLIEGPNQYDRLTDLFLNFFNFFFPDKDYRTIKNRSPPNDVKHLLDLIYRSWTPESFDGAVDLNENYPITVNNKSRFIPPAIELKAAHVKFREKAGCHSLFEITFENGTLFIPPLIISDETERFLRNLLTYEQYFQHEGKNYVGAYLNFMDSLINSSKDVDILTKYGIIHSWVGDHEVIANMFNRLMDSVISFHKHAYGQTFQDINAYRKKRWNRRLAVLNREYLRSPWSSISVVAASVLLILTIIQTACSILQVVEKK